MRNPYAPKATGFLLWRGSAKDWEVSAIAAQEPRLNEEITVRECRLIGFDGEQMGIYVTAEAQRVADNQGLDLVEIAPNAEPPVCRIMDYGKFKYDQAIKAKQARKNQSKVETKEMKFRPKIDVGDYTTKKKHVMRFLDAGNKVKITIMFHPTAKIFPSWAHHPGSGRRHTGPKRSSKPAQDEAATCSAHRPLPAATAAKKNEKKERTAILDEDSSRHREANSASRFRQVMRSKAFRATSRRRP